jgi:alkylmercury lyase
VQTRPLNLAELADAIAGAEPDLDPAEERIALAVYRLLAQGTPVAAADVAAMAGKPLSRVTALLDRWPGVFRNSEGNVVGFWGLAIGELRHTHRFEVDGRALYGWCAWDTLFLPGILERTGRVTSTCPTTGEEIELLVGPGGVVETSHPGAVVSFLPPDGAFDADMVQRFCHFVHLFATPEAGEAWVAERPGTFLLSLHEGFNLGDLTNRRHFPTALEGAR